MDNFLFKFKTGPNIANNTRAETRTVENFTFDVRTQWNDTYFLAWHCHTTASGISKYLKQSMLRFALG